MAYIVMEIKKNNGKLTVTHEECENISEAKNKYYTILSNASVSENEKHSASILNEKGLSLYHEGYEHPAEQPATEE